MENILEMLNNEQRSAATSKSQYLKISAGLGTGKTSTLAARILNLQITQELYKDNILAISFSRSAKQQLINRLRDYMAKCGSGSLIEILTFHSLAYQVIRNGIFCGESNFRGNFQVLSTSQIVLQKPELIKNLCQEYANRDLIVTALSKAFEMLRHGFEGTFYRHWQELNPYEEFKIEIESGERVIISGKDMIEFWKRIERICRIKNQLDYQGLITEAMGILEKEKYTYEQITSDLRHILVDEFQDTSLAQKHLLFQLAGTDKHIMAVGDENQAIYTFNGSNPGNMHSFYEHCHKMNPLHTEEIHLKKNYRSTKEIVDLSNHFIQKNIIEAINQVNDDNTIPYIVNTPTIELAASYIVKKIQNLRKITNVSYNDICILYRKNSEHSPQANQVIAALQSSGIPYKDDFADKKEIIDLKESLLQICDEYPCEPLQEIINHIEEQSIKEFLQSAIEKDVKDTDDLIDYLVELDDSVSDNVQDSVTIRSVHSAKGQEYPIVFILFLGDKQFPHGSDPDIEEERRLLYVGITRAQKQLFLLGQHGVHFEDFLGKCKTYSHIKYELKYNLGEENRSVIMSEVDSQVIKETEQFQELEESERQQHLEDLMAEW